MDLKEREVVYQIPSGTAIIPFRLGRTTDTEKIKNEFGFTFQVSSELLVCGSFERSNYYVSTRVKWNFVELLPIIECNFTEFLDGLHAVLLIPYDRKSDIPTATIIGFLVREGHVRRFTLKDKINKLWEVEYETF
jgi:hypothetical protein